MKHVSPDIQTEIVKLVDQMIAIYKKGGHPLPTGDNRKVREFEQQIDQKVYELYGLTEEEIALVEGSV